MPRVTLHVAVRNVPKCTNGHKVIKVWIQETHRVLKSQQIKMKVIYMHYFKKTCFPDHHHFMVAVFCFYGSWCVYMLQAFKEPKE